MSAPGCATCVASSKKCDRTPGPSGCRRCAQGGLECGEYSSEIIPNTESSVRDKESRSRHPVSAGTMRPVPLTRPTLKLVGSGKLCSPCDPSSIPHVLSSLNPSTSNVASGSGEYACADPLHSLDPLAVIPTFRQSTDCRSLISILPAKIPTPPVEFLPTPIIDIFSTSESRENVSPIGQMSTPPIEESPPRPYDQTRGGGMMAAGQESSFESLLTLGKDPSLSPSDPRSSAVFDPGSRGDRIFDTPRDERLGLQSEVKPITNPSIYYEDDDMDAENLESLQAELIDGLVLDREIESNTISFLVHS
ncbi:unnamed protein product, partial [Rhizoctonia solani]